MKKKVEMNLQKSGKKKRYRNKETETKREARGQFTAGNPKSPSFSYASLFPFYHVKTL